MTRLRSLLLATLALAACPGGDEKTGQSDLAHPAAARNAPANAEGTRSSLADRGQATAAAFDPGGLSEQSNISQHERGRDGSGPGGYPKILGPAGNAIGDHPAPAAPTLDPSRPGSSAPPATPSPAPVPAASPPPEPADR